VLFLGFLECKFRCDNLRCMLAAFALLQDPPNQPGYNWVWAPQWQVQMHQPETWGYLQFSDMPAEQPAAGGSSSGSSNRGSRAGSCADEFRPDPTWPARALLMDVYYAQTQCWEVGVVWQTAVGISGTATAVGAVHTDAVSSRVLHALQWMWASNMQMGQGV
jgi:hypothetical protein